jgi:hypothetical protein
MQTQVHREIMGNRAIWEPKCSHVCISGIVQEEVKGNGTWPVLEENDQELSTAGEQKSSYIFNLLSELWKNRYKLL